MERPQLPRQADALRALHKALRAGSREEALAIARRLRAHYRQQGGPASLLRFVEELLAEAGEDRDQSPIATLPPPTQDGSGSFRLGAARDGRRLAAALNLWQRLWPGGAPHLVDWRPPSPRESAPKAADLERELALAAQADGGAAFRWHDGWFRGAGHLQMRLEAWPERPIHQLVVCQAEAGRLLHCARLTLPQEGAAVLEAALANPFLPVLLAVLDREGLLVDLCLLPFPSLLRHGPHHAELCAAAERTSAGAFAWDCLQRQQNPDLPRIAILELPPGSSDGSEQLCRPALSRWLRQVWGLGRQAPGRFARGHEPGQRPEAMDLQLQLSGDGIPSLRALSGLTPDEEGDPSSASPFLLVDPCDFLPLTLCRPGREPRAPARKAAMGEPQRLGEDIAEYQGERPAVDPLIQLAQERAAALPFRSLDPVAVYPAVELSDPRYPLLVPTVPAVVGPEENTPRLRVLLLADDDSDSLHYSLWGLAQQEGVRLDAVSILKPATAMVSPPLAENIAACFPPGCLEQASLPLAPETLLQEQGANGPPLPCLVLRAGVCLHQPRTLAKLHELLSPPEVVSAGCLLVREQWFEAGRRITAQSCGLHPEEIRLDGPGPLTLVERDLLGSLGLRDLSVLAAVPDLVLLDTGAAAWRRASALPAACSELAQLLVERSVEAVLAGGLHRCSTRFSASYRRPPPPERRWRLPERLRRPLLADLPSLLRACTLVQRLEP